MKSKAKIEVNVEVQLNDSWSPDCTLSIIQEQAKRSALNKLQHVFGKRKDIFIIGEPKITVILIEEEQ